MESVKSLSFLECLVLFQIVEKEMEKVANLPAYSTALANSALYLELKNEIILRMPKTHWQ